MDSRQRVEKEIRLVLAIYRVEVGRRDSHEMARFGDRAQAIFDSLEAKIGHDPELEALLLAARWETRPEPPSAGGGLGQQAVDGGGQLGDGEGLG